MLKIKDYIFNEHEISHIIQMWNENLTTEYLNIFGKDGSLKSCISATFEDIEFDYEYKQDNEYINRLNNQIKELEEENKKLKDPSNYYQYASKLVKTNCENLQQRIDKAIEYIEEHKQLSMFADLRKENTHQYDLECDADDLLKILKGENNESN